MGKIITTLIVLILCVSTASFAQIGSLDNTFNSNGKVITAIGNVQDYAKATAVQSDGKILVAGYSTDNNAHDNFAIVRYKTDGTLDTSFNHVGIVTTTFPVNTQSRAYAMAIQSDGKILLAGERDSLGLDFALVRYKTDGSIDSTFDFDGKVNTGFDSLSTDYISAIALQSDGKIVVVGASDVNGNNQFALARYLSNGSLDSTFDTDGKLTTAIGTIGDNATGVAIQSDGKIVVTGVTTSPSFETEYATVRFNPNGTLDNTFGTAGKVITNMGNDFIIGPNDIKLQSDGKIVIAGNALFGANYSIGLVRYTNAGALDNTFGTNGITTTDIGTGEANARGLTIQSNGKIVVAGLSFNGSDNDFAVARYNIDGTLDNTFGTNGITTTLFTTNQFDEAFDVALQSDGKIVVAGTTDTGGNLDLAVARYIGTCILPVNLGIDISLCSGAQTTLDAGNPGATYLWSNGSTTQSITVTSTGTYSVTVTNGNCTGTDTILVTNTSLNLGVTTSANAFTASQTSATYQWLDCSNNYQPIVGATTQTYVQEGCIGETYNYAVELTKNGCIDTSACSTIVLSWTQRGFDIDGEDSFNQSGNSVALSADGNTMAIGAPLNDGNGNDAGHVKVYEWDGTTWLQKGADIDGESGENQLGTSVSLTSNGNVLAIGVIYGNGNQAVSGYTRVYAWNSISGGWVQKGSDINGEATFDYSGASVSLSSDGNIIAIGAYENDGNDENSGNVRVYVWNTTTSEWEQRGGNINGEATFDYSGKSVSLSSDGSIVAIGAIGNTENGDFSGHVRVYAWNGITWVQRGLDIDGEAMEDFSGTSVSLSGDGTVLAIGAPGTEFTYGYVKIYLWSGLAWEQRGQNINGESNGDASGYSVSLSSEGSTVAIGTTFTNDSEFETGFVKIYEWNGIEWVQRGPKITGEADSDESGYSVSLSSDGNVVAIGAPYNDGNGENSGHVRVYETCTLFAGIEEEDSNTPINAIEVSIYPNPSTGIFNISVTNNALDIKHLRVLNVLGSEVYRTNLTENTKIDLSNHASGVYLLTLENDEQQLVYRVIKE
jgi:uncharacterized delta-60 repeat protein